ncbi:hypothetical protein [Gottfriedia acidiceleris]|uniref:hypothetical protein n=1 Tax=Gottfriedia acidiceleris TaxID=371036 RepID=UPI00101D7EB2|nr:hypothetical protein [Gottfriedia acidiceleris]
MITIMSQLKNRIFKDRIKQIVIIQTILMIPMMMYVVYSFTSDNTNHIYEGLFHISLAAIFFSNVIEEKILKKKESNALNLWLMCAIMFFIIGIIDLFFDI